MNITEKQKQQLINLNDSRVNEILNMTPELNKWYKATDSKFMIYLTKHKDDNKCEGFYFSELNGEYIGFCDDLGFHRCILATKQQIEQALTNEAKRRGFENVGDLSITFVDGRNFKKGFFDTSDNKFRFCRGYNTILLDGVEIFNNGQWAKITDEKSELKEEIKELRRKLKSLEEKL